MEEIDKIMKKEKEIIFYRKDVIELKFEPSLGILSIYYKLALPFLLFFISLFFLLFMGITPRARTLGSQTARSDE